MFRFYGYGTKTSSADSGSGYFLILISCYGIFSVDVYLSRIHGTPFHFICVDDLFTWLG